MTQSVAELVKNRIQVFVGNGKGDSARLVTGNERLGELEIDSLKIIELIFELERTYQIEISEHQLQDLQTVNDLIAIVEGARSTVTIA